MSSRLPLHLVLALTTTTVACTASMRAPERPTSARVAFATTTSAVAVIEADELAHLDVHTAYDAIVRLRPQFLLRQPTNRIERPEGQFATVYLDDRRQGSLELLHTMPLGMVREIRFLTPTEAASRFGGSHPSGVIAVESRRR